ncbi:MAG TPA: hypothetical protein VGG64_03075 [Pirellulales bacterium]|jgi:hypothetical protein
MLKEPDASLLVASVVDYCQANRGYEAERLSLSMRRLMSSFTPAEIDEIGRRARRHLGISDGFTAGSAAVVICSAPTVS